MEPEPPVQSRSRASSTTILGKHANGVPVASAPSSPLAFWPGLLVVGCGLLYTVLFATKPSASTFLGLFPAFYLSLPLKVFPVLLLSAFTSYPGVIPTGALSASLTSQYKLYISRGLLASAAGDLCLDLYELPGMGEAPFVVGLLAFLAAHILYSIGFYKTTARPVNALVAVACILPTAIVLSLLAPHILNNPQHAPLFGPVCVYVTAICVMWYLSLARLDASASAASTSLWLTAGGATVFLVSDVALAFDKFAPPPTRADGSIVWWFAQPKVVVMVLYYAAQCLITSGAWLSTEGRPKAKSI